MAVHRCSTRSGDGGDVMLFGTIIKKSSESIASPLSHHQVTSGHPAYGNPRGRDRKKGTPWTEQEHRLFLEGLRNVGKGNWRGIARKYVLSRTPTQVASHAQKFFIRQGNNPTLRKRRSSILDIVPDDMAAKTTMVPSNQAMNGTSSRSMLSLNLSLNSELETTSKETIGGSIGFISVVPGAFSFVSHEKVMPSHHQFLLKPIPVFAKQPVSSAGW
ncbi:hypothetical protein ACFE04_008608 [Oxalis oulophora]